MIKCLLYKQDRTWEIILFGLLVIKLPLGAGLGSSPPSLASSVTSAGPPSFWLRFSGSRAKGLLSLSTVSPCWEILWCRLFWFNLCYLWCMIKKNKKVALSSTNDRVTGILLPLPVHLERFVFNEMQCVMEGGERGGGCGRWVLVGGEGGEKGSL